ncbi:DUF2970 domain-containing protein [Simiduia aestuariiviva]|uniref:Ribonucleotide reductase beta subunit family protein with ferritin-like domain n=1 Tax=Simiduia aestuariiviva TaxID=1510459 RepID=A0A839URL5_9GAMM|nr:DUF2970 domain-containing protein [Simiduia aestuariiviva]MBB3168178.1 ribonucleotide reductase beta subunit family protein with ferritin-like domain [Simiduia aestuariiviva]
MSEESQPQRKPSFGSIVISTLAAAIGVQSKKNQERDFSGGNIYHYIAAGLIFTLGFIVCMTLIVQAVLKNSGL